jgi:hypothetical protein
VRSYSGGGEPHDLSLWPPLPLIVLRDRAHQPSNGLGVPDPDASEGPNGPLVPLVERSIQQFFVLAIGWNEQLTFRSM